MSTLTEQPIGATVAVVLVNLMMIICDAVEQLSWLHPWLLTHWWTAFGDLLRDPIATADIQRGLLTFGAYALVFWLLAWARFTTKEDWPQVVGVDLHADASLARRGCERGSGGQGLGEQHRGAAVQDPERLARAAVDRHPTDQVGRAEVGELDAEVTYR